MANFPAQAARSPVSIGRIDHFLDSPDPALSQQPSLRYNLSVLDGSGEEMSRRNGNEQPYLTQGQINGLLAFMADRRANLPGDLGWPVGHTVGRATWRFRDGDGSNPSRSLYARVVQLDAVGAFVEAHIIDDEPNLSAAQLNSAVSFLNSQRSKAETEILP